jgi:MFS transporter, DHA3 family, macrolide efflux protein
VRQLLRIILNEHCVRIYHPLRIAPVALLWGGLSLSAVGDQLYSVALAWIAVSVLGPEAGYFSSLQALVVLLAVLGIGTWADRQDQRRAMIGADLARAAILLVVVGTWLAMGRPNIALLIAAVIVLALGQAVFQPALQSLLPPLVTAPGLLPAANGLLDATDRSARLIGPGLVALAAGLIPTVHFLTLDAASFVASAAALAWIGLLRRDLAPVRHTTREPLRATIRRGWQATRAHPLLGYVLATAGLVNGAWYAVFFLGVPLIITRHHLAGANGSGLGAYGLIISAYGCTNLAATIVFGSRALPRRPQFQMFGGNLFVGTGMALIGLASLLPAGQVPAMALAAALGAIGGPMKDIPLAVLRQTRVPRPDIPAAMRVYMAMNSAGTLLAMLIAPLAFARLGSLPTVLICGATLITIGVVGLARHARWDEGLEFAAA